MRPSAKRGGEKKMTKTHYHAMAGLHGCMPSFSDVYDDYGSAVEELASLHELGEKRRRELKRDGYLELNIRRDGNEYCEITECHDDECINSDDWSAWPSHPKGNTQSAIIHKD
jgi:hypothetical protein